MPTTLVSNVSIVLLLLLFSFALRVALSQVGQSWVRTLPHTATIFFLPITTFCITKVISGNIALSLGMVGALSIVRFRNPVRSPLELTVYFVTITMGIVASVSSKWLFFFIGSLCLSFVILIGINVVTQKVFKRQFFQYSFTEGNTSATLEVYSKKPIPELKESPLIVGIKLVDNEYVYLLSSTEFKALKELIDKVSETYDIKNFQLNA